MATEFEAGSAYLQILPSLKDFKERLKAGLDEQGTDFLVEVLPELSEAFKAKLDADLKDIPPVELNAESTDADRKVAELKAQLDELRSKTVGVDIDPEEALAAVAAIEGEIDQLTGTPAKLNLDTTDAESKVAEVASDVKAISDEPVTVQVKADLDTSSVEKVREEIENEPPVTIPTATGPVRPRQPFDDLLFGTGTPKPIAVDPGSIDTAWRAQLQSQISAISADALQIPMTPDTRAYRRGVAALLAQVEEDSEQQISMATKDADRFRADVEGLVSSLSDSVKAKIAIEVDPASVAAFEAEAKAAADKAAEDSKNSSGSGGFNPGIGTLIAGGIGVGAGPLAGAALALIPAGFAAIGIAAEASNKQVSASFSDMERSAKGTLQAGFAPFVPTLVSLSGQAKTTLAGLEPELAQAATATAPLIQDIGDGVLKAAQYGVGGAATMVGKLQPIAQTVAAGIGQLAHGVGGFFTAINVTGANRGLEDLFSDVEQILPAAARLLNTIAPLGDAVLEVLGPALVSAVNDAEHLEPVLDAVGAALRFLQPDIVVLGPPLAAALGLVKLTTGSWTDFSGALTKVKNGITGLPDTIQSLGQKMGYTTAAANQQKQALAAQSASLAQLKKDVADEAVAEAASAAASDRSAASRLALRNATQEAAVAAKEAEEAEAALAATTEEATFSAGPLGIALGAIGLLLAPLVANATAASQQTQDLTGNLQKLQQAASDTKSLSDLFQSDPNAEKQLQLLQRYGITVQDLAAANDGNAAAQQKVAAAAKQASDAINAKTAADKANLSQLSDAEAQVDASGSSYSDLSAQVDKARQAVAADEAAQQLANSTLSDAQNQVQANTAAQAANTSGLGTGRAASDAWTSAIRGAATQMASTGGDLIGLTQQMYNFEQASGETTLNMEAYEKAQIAAASANVQAEQSFQQLDQAVSSAEESYKQSVQSVADAEHSQAQAAQSVVTAEQGVQTAVQGVATAEQQVATAQGAATTAQVQLTAARAAAAQQLADYNLQLKDQADSEAEAKVQLLDAQIAVKNAGLEGQSLASLGGPTAQNEASYKLLLSLSEAQNNLNDVQSQGSQLSAQAAAAQAAGIEGNSQVIAAEQQVVQAQQQEAQSAQSLVSARNAVAQAAQQVADAEYQQKQASVAVQQASYAEQQAAQALTLAHDAASRSTDVNTAAGNRNVTTIIGLYDAQIQAGKTTDQARAAVEQEATALDFAKGKVDDVINSIQAVPPSVTFGIVGQPSLDVTSLLQNAQSQGINLYSLGLPTSEVQAYLNPTHAVAPAVHALTPKATGGPIEGYSPNATADNIPILATAGEFMHPVSTVNYYGTGLMEAIRQRAIPREQLAGFASGGLIGQQLLGVNYRMLGYDSLLGAMGTALGTLGAQNVPQLPAALPTISFAGLAAGGTGSTGSAASPSSVDVSGLRAPAAANEALMQQIWAQQYGWTGPEWTATQYLMMRESGFDNTAQNPHSTAYGQFQFLDSTWAGYGIAKTSDPRSQDIAGGRYIEARYGDPIGAAAHERAYSWFDSGGWLPPGMSMVANGTGAPEAVFTSEQWSILAGNLKNPLGDLTGLTLTGSLETNPDGTIALIDARVSQALDSTGQAIATGTRTLY